jgi:hypothetical protein
VNAGRKNTSRLECIPTGGWVDGGRGWERGDQLASIDRPSLFIREGINKRRAAGRCTVPGQTIR